MQVCKVKMAVLEYGLETGFNKELYIMRLGRKAKNNSQKDSKISKFLFKKVYDTS